MAQARCSTIHKPVGTVLKQRKRRSRALCKHDNASPTGSGGWVSAATDFLHFTDGATRLRRAQRAGIEAGMGDAICGHSPRTVADEYETPSPEDMAAAMKKFPRYEV